MPAPWTDFLPVVEHTFSITPEASRADFIDICYANEVSDDVIEGGPFDWSGGHLQLSARPGHGLRLDPERLERYRYTAESVAPHRAYAKKLYADYRLDRPRRTSQSGWPKRPGAETFSRHIYPYSLAHILGADEAEDIDLELNY